MFIIYKKRQYNDLERFFNLGINNLLLQFRNITYNVLECWKSLQHSFLANIE